MNWYLLMYIVLSILWSIYAMRVHAKIYPEGGKFHLLLSGFMNLILPFIGMLVAIIKMPLPESHVFLEFTEEDKHDDLADDGE